MIKAKETPVRYEGLPPLFPARTDFFHIPRNLHGDTVFILGGGSSFDPALADKLKDHFVIGCNDAYQLGGEVVDWCHFTDLKWWLEHEEKLSAYTGTLSTVQGLVLDPAVKILKGKRKGIEFENTSCIGVNRNTGLGAINIAVHLGAKKIVLLGFDMGSDEEMHHWYQRESGPNSNTFRMHRRFALEVWEDIAEHGAIEIINASPNSTLPYWPKCELSEVLP